MTEKMMSEIDYSVEHPWVGMDVPAGQTLSDDHDKYMRAVLNGHIEMAMAAAQAGDAGSAWHMLRQMHRKVRRWDNQ
jgi:hypothetical protein